MKLSTIQKRENLNEVFTVVAIDLKQKREGAR